jgi:hypothetical protein
MVDRRLLLIGRELEDAPDSLLWTNKPTGNITADLIVRSANHGRRTVRTLVYVLVDIFDGLNRSVYLNVYIILILL